MLKIWCPVLRIYSLHRVEDVVSRVVAWPVVFMESRGECLEGGKNTLGQYFNCPAPRYLL